MAEFRIRQRKPSRRQHSPFDQSCYLVILLAFHTLLLSLSSIHRYSLCGCVSLWKTGGMVMNKQKHGGTNMPDDLRETMTSSVPNVVTEEG